jgi:hypothetical protein
MRLLVSLIPQAWGVIMIVLHALRDALVDSYRSGGAGHQRNIFRRQFADNAVYTWRE